MAKDESLLVMIEVGRCPICGVKTWANSSLPGYTSLCENNHCGPNSWCRVTKTIPNIITEIRIPVHNTAVILKHFHTTEYTFVYTDENRSKMLFYFPKLVFNDFNDLRKTQQKLSTYLMFS